MIYSANKSITVQYQIGTKDQYQKVTELANKTENDEDFQTLKEYIEKKIPNYQRKVSDIIIFTIIFEMKKVRPRIIVFIFNNLFIFIHVRTHFLNDRNKYIKSRQHKYARNSSNFKFTSFTYRGYFNLSFL